MHNITYFINIILAFNNDNVFFHTSTARNYNLHDANAI